MSMQHIYVLSKRAPDIKHSSLNNIDMMQDIQAESQIKISIRLHENEIIVRYYN